MPDTIQSIRKGMGAVTEGVIQNRSLEFGGAKYMEGKSILFFGINMEVVSINQYTD